MNRELPFDDFLQIAKAMLDGYHSGNFLVYGLPVAYLLQCTCAFICLHLANTIDPNKVPNTFLERSFANQTINRFHDQAARFVVVSSIGLFVFMIGLTFNANVAGALIVTWFKSYPALIFAAIQITSLYRNSFALWRDLGME